MEFQIKGEYVKDKWITFTVSGRQNLRGVALNWEA